MMDDKWLLTPASVMGREWGVAGCRAPWKTTQPQRTHALLECGSSVARSKILKVKKV